LNLQLSFGIHDFVQIQKKKSLVKNVLLQIGEFDELFK
jgi:hypothetical protein